MKIGYFKSSVLINKFSLPHLSALSEMDSQNLSIKYSVSEHSHSVLNTVSIFGRCFHIGDLINPNGFSRFSNGNWWMVDPNLLEFHPCLPLLVI